MSGFANQIIKMLLGCVTASGLSSCASDKGDEKSFQQAIRTVNAARPQRALAAKDAAVWTKRYVGRVIKVRGRIEHLSLHMGAITLEGGVHCFLARDEEKRLPLVVGSVVVLKGLLVEEELAAFEGHGTPVFACVILATRL